MNRARRFAPSLPAVCACAILIVVAALVLPAILGNGPNGGVPEHSTTPGLTPFIADGGSIAAACDDVTTCVTGAITNVETGDTLVVVVTEFTTSHDEPTTVEEVTSGGYVAVPLLGDTPCIAGSGHGVTAIYGLADVPAQASITLVVNYSTASFYTIHGLDVQGASATPFEAAGTGICSAAAGATATASVTTTVAGDLVILGVEVRASTTIAASGGDTLVTQAVTTGADLDSGAMLEENDATTGAISLSATFTSASWSAIAVALEPPPPPLVSGTVSPSLATIDAGQTIGLTTTAATGGTAPITYQWYIATSASTCSSGTLVVGATGQSYTTPTLSVSTDYYCVWATDSTTPTAQVVYSNVATITVNTALTVSITPSAPSIDSGQSIQLTAEPAGGTGADTFAWFLGATCSGSSLATTQAYTTPALLVDTTYCVNATDSAPTPTTANATDTVTVSSSPLAVTITPSAPNIESGQSVLLTAHPTGGSGADTFAWFLGGTCAGAVLATTQAYTTANLTADRTYCVNATDSAYIPVTANATASVTVTAASLTLTITPAAPSIDSGQTVELTAVPSGGTAPYTYAWYAGSACSGTVLAVAQAYSTAALSATTTYCVEATDNSTVPLTATADATVTVSAAPLSVTVTPSAPSIPSGGTVQLTAVPAGGTGADSFAWYAGATCSGSVLATSKVYTTTALTSTTSYCVAVTDSAFLPVTANASAVVTVTAASAASSVPPASDLPVIIGVIVAVALAALLLLAILARRRRKVIFVATGLPEGTAWSVTLREKNLDSKDPRIAFTESKGEYRYTVKRVSGYTAAPPSGTVKVGKDPVEVKITFTTLPP
jgi:hypothetical protein